MSIVFRLRILITLVVLAHTFPLFGSQAVAGDKTPLVICGTTWGKLSGPDLPNNGFVADLVMRVFRHAGYEATYKIVPWARCIVGVKELKYDIVASAWHGESIDADYDYLNDILYDTINFIVLDSSPVKVGSMESFNGKRVAVVREVTGIEEMFAGHDKIDVHRVTHLNDLPRMLIGERFDAIVSDPVSLNEVMKTQGLSADHTLKTLQPPLKLNIQAPIISKTHPNKDQIISDFNESFLELVSEGMYSDLIALHDFQAQYPEDYKVP